MFALNSAEYVLMASQPLPSVQSINSLLETTSILTQREAEQVCAAGLSEPLAVIDQPLRDAPVVGFDETSLQEWKANAVGCIPPAPSR